MMAQNSFAVALDLESSGPNFPEDCGESVLIVEDDADVRRSIAHALDELGYLPIEAPDPLQAVVSLQSGMHIDLLIADVSLPYLNGRQLADIARARHPELKVLFVTGHTHSKYACDFSLDHGMQVLSKPFTSSRLAAEVRRLVDSRSPRHRFLM
jgi:DNA-binding NtrC family response regulator